MPGLVVALILWWQERQGRPLKQQEDRWLRINLGATLTFLGVPEAWRRMKAKPELVDRLVRPPIGEIVRAIDQGFKRVAQEHHGVTPRQRQPRAQRLSRPRTPKRASTRSRRLAREDSGEKGDADGPDSGVTWRERGASHATR